MVESVAGEIIAALGGVAICAPLFYQIQSLFANPVKSPLRAASWHLWTVGFLGLAIFFGHVPSNDRPASGKHHRVEDVPSSPRTFAIIGLLACALCELCWSLDHAGPGRRGRQRATQVGKTWIPALVVILTFYYAMGFVHKSLVRFNPFYRDALAIIAFVLIGISGIGFILAVLSQAPSQLRRGGAEVAGLYWMPVAMQTLGYFTGIIDCVLVYTYVEWYGVGMLGTMLAFDLLYILGSRLKARKFQKQYGSIPVDENEGERHDEPSP